MRLPQTLFGVWVAKQMINQILAVKRKIIADAVFVILHGGTDGADNSNALLRSFRYGLQHI